MKSKGFTIIELLVVIAVIGLLASIVLVSLSPARQKARDARRYSDIRQISLAMEMQYDDNAEKYPIIYVTATSTPTISSIDWDADGGRNKAGEAAAPFQIGTYLTIPEDPQGGQYHAVANVGNEENKYYETDYCIYADLEILGSYVVATEDGVKTQDSICAVP